MKKVKPIIKAWTTEVCTHSSQIDPSNELHWRSLFIGFAIGKGLSLKEAIDWSLYANEAFPCEGNSAPSGRNQGEGSHHA